MAEKKQTKSGSDSGNRISNEMISEIEILQSELIYKEIIPVIFHKLKNKLTPVLGYSQIIRMKSGSDLINDKASNIEKNAELLSGLIDMIRDQFTEIEIEKENIPFKKLIDNFSSIFDILEKTGIKVNVTIKAKNKVKLIKGEILLLLRELLQNSISSLRLSNKKEGRINIDIEDMDSGIILRFSDNGDGVAEEELKMVTEPFYSLFPQRAGIGYLLIEKVVENHEGSLKLYSEKGANFEVIINLPLESIKNKINGSKSFLSKIYKLL